MVSGRGMCLGTRIVKTGRQRERERWNHEREQEVEGILVIEKKRLRNRDEQMVKECFF